MRNLRLQHNNSWVSDKAMNEETPNKPSWFVKGEHTITLPYKTESGVMDYEYEMSQYEVNSMIRDAIGRQLGEKAKIHKVGMDDDLRARWITAVITLPEHKGKIDFAIEMLLQPNGDFERGNYGFTPAEITDDLFNSGETNQLAINPIVADLMINVINNHAYGYGVPRNWIKAFSGCVVNNTVNSTAPNQLDWARRVFGEKCEDNEESRSILGGGWIKLKSNGEKWWEHTKVMEWDKKGKPIWETAVLTKYYNEEEVLEIMLNEKTNTSNQLQEEATTEEEEADLPWEAQDIAETEEEQISDEVVYEEVETEMDNTPESTLPEFDKTCMPVGEFEDIEDEIVKGIKERKIPPFIYALEHTLPLQNTNGIAGIRAEAEAHFADDSEVMDSINEYLDRQLGSGHLLEGDNYFDKEITAIYVKSLTNNPNKTKACIRELHKWNAQKGNDLNKHHFLQVLGQMKTSLAQQDGSDDSAPTLF